MSIPPSPMLDLRGRAYVVTGASRGIGLSIVHALARRGARIGMLARGADELRQRAEEIGDDAMAVPVDVGSRADVTRAINAVAERFGGLHGIVNNAGLSRLSPVIETTEADAHMMISINLLGTLFCSQAARPHLRKAGGGTIINMSSSTVRHRDEFPHMGFYSGLKAAIDRMSMEMRDELKHEGIAVTIFSPGATLTYAGTNWDEGMFERGMAEWLRQGTYCDSYATPDIVGEAIVRMLELPPGTAYDFAELRPNVPSLRRPMQAGLEDDATTTPQSPERTRRKEKPMSAAEATAAQDPILNQPQIYDPYEYALHDDPYPVYQRLRDEFPLFYNQKHDFYAVSRYADCMAVLRNFKVFANRKGTTLEKELIPGVLPFILMMDPPEHTRLRHLMVDQFRPQNVAPLEGIVRDMARRLLAPHLAAGKIDIIDDFAAKLPMAIICTLMGVRTEDEDMLRGWTDDIVGREDGSNEITQVNIEGTQKLLEYFETMIQERAARGVTGDDLVGQLMGHEAAGKIQHIEVLGYLFLLAIAGNETTTKLIGNFTYQLWANQDQRALVLADRSLCAATIEETLRIDGPTQMQARETSQPIEMHGHVIPAGAKVAVILLAGNRDERHYVDADVFRIDRKARDHLGFGGGLHSCLGAALARLEGRVALEEMLDTMPDWEIDLADTRRMHSAYVRGYTHLPIRFTPRSS